MAAAVHRRATLSDAARLFEVRRRSILELAPSGMSVAEAEAWANKLTPAGMLWRLNLPPQHEAASSVRERVAAGEEWQDDVPPAVAAYIRTHRLYAASR